MKLYTFFRSSASYRVRIALNHKGLDYEQVPIHLRRGGGEQLAPEYKAINPHGLVPTLEEGGRTLTQSLAIIEYLEERFPNPPLLPADPADRATVRAMALAIACEIHPLQNLRVLRHLRSEFKQGEEEVNRWAQHWIHLGLLALEEQVGSIANRALAIACEIHPLQNLRVLRHLRSEFKQGEEEVNRWAQHWIHLGLLALEEQVGSIANRGKFCFGNRVSLADICLVPQLANARRFSCDLSGCPGLVQIEANCVQLPAFAKAAPENQPDAE